jgi:hypothetical protein
VRNNARLLIWTLALPSAPRPAKSPRSSAPMIRNFGARTCKTLPQWGTRDTEGRPVARTSQDLDRQFGSLQLNITLTRAYDKCLRRRISLVGPLQNPRPATVAAGHRGTPGKSPPMVEGAISSIKRRRGDWGRWRLVFEQVLPWRSLNSAAEFDPQETSANPLIRVRTPHVRGVSPSCGSHRDGRGGPPGVTYRRPVCRLGLRPVLSQPGAR